MIMQVINLKKCPSTQGYLINLIKKFPKLAKGPTLVQSDEQTEGYGRKGNQWVHQKDSLAISFTLPQKKYQFFTPIFLAVAIKEFLDGHNCHLTLKWPNDLCNEDKKIGGLICQQVDEQIVCGLGINLKLNVEAPDNWGHIELKTPIRKITSDLYHFLLSYNLDTKVIKDRWESYCFHQNKKVLIKDHDFSTQGTFVGIDENGSALIDNSLEIKTISTGSLFLV